MSHYPDSQDLKQINNWEPPQPWSGERPWLPVLDLMDDAWNHDMGRASRDGNVWTFITGGWSGNEEIIGALQANWPAYSLLWLASFRGGKHQFGIEKDTP